MTAAALAKAAARQRMRIKVRGTVQGVGFRPFVWREAIARGLAGYVTNTPEGVTLEVEGSPEGIAGLVDVIRTAPPPTASVTHIAVEKILEQGERGFEIRRSMVSGVRTASILPDLATCDECLSEVSDPTNRRYRYPFTNCTHCGPRYSIIEGLPYDRARTTMRRFVMCGSCQAEYDDPSDRRFHAEPNACPDCGPMLALRDSKGTPSATGNDALLAAARALARGEIVAMKGLGGFHLMADATNDAAVRRLRQRKHREDKPFAVMFGSPAAAEAEATLSAAETMLLASRERPIVLVRRNDGALAESVAPRNPFVGAMLPYTPLHHLLLAETGFPLVATSGNRSDEPIVTDEAEATLRLAGIADLYLVHDRPIVRPVDDSVVRVIAGRPQVLRRARSYAPAPIAAQIEPGILALGGHLKATVALSTAAGVVVSQHLGDLDTPQALDAYDTATADLTRLHDRAPRVVVSDLHPDYHSSRVADRFGTPIIAVQHHVAHIAACMAEHQLNGPLLGVAWDGTGYGTDGTVWGGEFIAIDGSSWRRVARLRPFPLPGSEAAVREPRRSALGLLFAAYRDDAFAMTDLPPVADFTREERDTLATMMKRGVNAPLTSSAGRLFDAVAALTGLRQRTSYEGQAAAELEWAASSKATRAPYDFPVRDTDGDPRLEIDWRPALAEILADIRAGTETAAISAAFHDGLATTIARVAAMIGEKTVVLTGGCFQNARLSEAAIAALRASGIAPWWHQSVPANDGGLALGQAFWASRTGGF